MPITAERGTYTCSRCHQRKPFGDFRLGGRINSITGDWICGTCNACPDCGLSRGDGGFHIHRCHVPLLTTALGVKLTPREKRLIGWLCSSIERSDAKTLAELFARSRAGESTTPSKRKSLH